MSLFDSSDFIGFEAESEDEITDKGKQGRIRFYLHCRRTRNLSLSKPFFPFCAPSHSTPCSCMGYTRKRVFKGLLYVFRRRNLRFQVRLTGFVLLDRAFVEPTKAEIEMRLFAMSRLRTYRPSSNPSA